MIDLALKKIKEEIQTYLSLKTQSPAGEEQIILGAISSRGSVPLVDNRLYMSLVSIEQERVNASYKQIAEIKPDNSTALYNPAINLNLFILFSSFFNDYGEALKFISHMISFFQGKTTFNSSNTPGLDPEFGQLSFEIYNQSSQDSNYMWSMLGNSYQPSVLYKARLITIQEKQTADVGTVAAGIDAKTGELK